MNEFKDDVNESCSSNLLFLRENHFQRVNIWPQRLTLKFENALYFSAHCKILVTGWKKINMQGWSAVVKTGLSVECWKF